MTAEKRCGSCYVSGEMRSDGAVSQAVLGWVASKAAILKVLYGAAFIFQTVAVVAICPRMSWSAVCAAAVGADQLTGLITDFYDAKGIILVSTDNGLFSFDPDEQTLKQIPTDQDTGSVLSVYDARVYDARGTILVGTNGGIFSFDPHRLTLTQIAAYQDTGGVLSVYDARGTILVGTNQGLFSFDPDRLTLTRIVASRDTGSVSSFYDARGTILVGTNKGPFRFDPDKQTLTGISVIWGTRAALWPKTVAADQNIGSVSSFYDARGTTLVGTDQGLFRFDLDKQTLTPIAVDEVNGVSSIENANDTILVSTDNGLFSFDAERLTLTQIATDRDTGSVSSFYNARGTILISTDKGLFRFNDRPWSKAIVRRTSPGSEDLPIGVKTTLTWTVKHPCAFALTEGEISITPILEFPEKWEITVKHDAGAARVEATGAFAKKSDTPYLVRLQLRDDTGKFVPLGTGVSVRVNWAPSDYLKYYGKRASWIAGGAYLTLFVLLVIGAHWSTFCWRIVTDPIWNKVQVGFYFTLSYGGPLRRWVMARWFNKIRQVTSVEPYLPMSLSEGDGPVGLSTELLNRNANWQRLWVQGGPGMGKTALVRYMQSEFFANTQLPTLARAFKHFGSIPIIVSLRDYRQVAYDPSHPEDWVVSVARIAASARGFTFEGDRPFSALIKSGDFLLVLDGANEVERNDAIDLFARSAPGVRILVTSQVSTDSDYFTNWHLPRTITSEIRPLLCEFLGQQTGEQIFVRIKSTPLLNAIQSGYDVRLIADLVETHGPDVALPGDRLGLYRLILASIPMQEGSQFPEDQLCKAAWDIWRDGERKLEVGKQLDKDLLSPLIKEGQKVLRTLDGQHYEFRHDQMRAYLAARWAARYEVYPISLFEQDKEIWRLPLGEQDEVWSFFADMLTAKKLQDAVDLWKWSTAHPERVRIQHALQGALKRAGLDPQISRPISAASS